MMLALSCFWLLLGLLVGLLGVLAKFWPSSWGRKKWRAMLSIGSLAAFCGGWLGTPLLGRFFASSVALCIVVLCVVVLSRVFVWVQHKHVSLFPVGSHK